MHQEEIIVFGEEENLIGIYNSGLEQKSDTAVIFLNAGIIHRVGPNQLYSKLSDQINSLNISTFRFDFSGIGDSSFSESDFSPQESYFKSVLEAVEYLSVYKEISRFILIGLCSGADVSLKVALHSDKITGICFINGEYFNVNGIANLYSIVNRKIIFRYNLKNILNLKRWIKLIFRKKVFKISKLKEIWRFLSDKKNNIASDNIQSISTPEVIDHIYSSWLKIIERRLSIFQVYSEGSIGLDLYRIIFGNKKKKISAKNLNIMVIKNTDHIFTPKWSQNLLTKSVCNWLKYSVVEKQ